MVNTIIEFLKNNMIDCMWVKLLGSECPGCGTQRSIIFLLEGNLKDSFMTYPALIPTIILIFFMISHLIFKFKNGARWIMFLFITTLLIMIINYIIKMIY